MQFEAELKTKLTGFKEKKTVPFSFSTINFF